LKTSKDEALTLLALKKKNIINDLIVACDGVEALDYLSGLECMLRTRP